MNHTKQKAMHKTRLHIIRIFTLLMLLLVGAGNGAWAKEIRYHILTLPFNVRNGYNTGNRWPNNIRVEAMLVKYNSSTVGLPDQYISPLAKNFKYWKSWETPVFDYLYDNANNSHLAKAKYYIYSENGGGTNLIDMSLSSDIDASQYDDIYVTYEYDDSKYVILNGSQDYNVTVGTRYMCFNRSRNNRIGNANAPSVTGEYLVSQQFVLAEAGTQSTQLGFNWSNDKYHGAPGVHFGFWFEGTDPYNITIKTAYTGLETYDKDPVPGDPEPYVKPYKGSTLFSKIISNNDNNGSDTKMWFDCDNDVHYKGESTADWQTQVDQWPGFFRGTTYPLFNTVALLNHPNGGYVFVASKLNQGNDKGNYTEYHPNKNGNYATMTDDNNNPRMTFKTLKNSKVINIYKIRTYTFNIKTHGSTPTTFTKTMRWSDAMASEKVVDHIPEVLKRKYVSYTAYSDEALTTPISTFDDAVKANNGNVIWLKYEVTESLPFETLPDGGSYTEARWYTMRVNGKAEAKNIAYNSSDNLITGATSIGDNSNLHTGENSADAQVAFIGDPYELKIISRAASETANGNRYIGCATGAANNTPLNTNKTGTSDISTWEIAYESTDMENFILRQFNTYAAPKYVGWGSATNKPVIYSTDSTRIRVVALNKEKYAYYIVRNNAGNIAVMATASEDVGKALRSYTDIPEIIRSPFLDGAKYGANVSFYETLDDAKNKTNAKNHVPYNKTDGLTDGVYANVYVRYSYPTPLTGGTFNVILNNEYIYTSSNDIHSKASISSTEANSGPYKWILNYRDPYAMTIENFGNGSYIKTASSLTEHTSLEWDTDVANASPFIFKQSGDNEGIYEVMAATGDGVDASVTYYNIGRSSSTTTELYSNATYRSGYSQLQFQLIGTDAGDITYHLIDKAGKDLLQVTTRQVSTDKPAFPPQYRSPLVEEYYYYAKAHFTITNGEDGIANTADDIYTLKSGATPLSSVASDIYVTYKVNDLVNLKRGQMYLLKYEGGQLFRQENGGDDLLAEPDDFVGTDEKKAARYKAVYPYCNGDCNFFVYGQEQYDLQQEGAASTRTRWAWYVQSDLGDTGDPYHVKIMSRQTETYPSKNGSERNAYFGTFKPEGYTEVVTSLVWPDISGIQPTEYMVLGNPGQYQLVTTNEVEGSRHVVNSFEQYWKTFDTIRKKIYGDNISNSAADPNDPDVVPADVFRTKGATSGQTLRDYLTNDLKWHSYAKYAYAKRWDGCNNADPPAQSKGWEKIEHWFQTVSMGEGYFDFVATTIDPVLILLDQHGWEVMRKPLPNSPDDPNKTAKYDAIRPYNSPMVKEYAFWATAKKRSGLHQYYQMKDRIGGDNFTSTDLTNLPPYDSKNVKNKKGDLNDQYVTYIVKDEYAQSYNPSTKTGVEFMIEQGSKYATTDGTTITASNVPEGGIQKYILEHPEDITPAMKWYVKPNWNIDVEMGYKDVAHSWGSNPNAYETTDIKDKRTARYINDGTLGQFSFSNGFDPYNIQIVPSNNTRVDDKDTKFMKINATGADLEDGVMHGVYSSTPAISLGDSIPYVDPNNSIWFDGRKLSITNATYMAVQDAQGNMQLMPRFDHDRRMSEFGTLILPTDAVAATTTPTTLYRPVVYEYLIIDNAGHESLRYKSGGDLLPQMPDHFKSPLAKDFTYYATASESAGTYSNFTDSIKGSLDGVTLTGNKIYVRYEYDEEADFQHILRGNWLTMQITEKDAKYDSGIKLAKSSKPATVDGTAANKPWQWKFTENPQSEPDPYAAYLFNRSQTKGTKAIANQFAILSHPEGGYALAKTGRKDYTYDFLNGSSSTASFVTESGFKSSSGTFEGVKSQVQLFDDVQHAFNYKVYTNGGLFAIDADQDFYDVTVTNDWKPVLPDDARTPLLDIEQYRFYEKSLEGTIAESDTAGLALPYLFGLYDDVIYTHYTPYQDSESNYLVPNVRNATTETTIARGSKSNDAPLGLDGIRPYNIIWYSDNMMKSNGTTIESGIDQPLQAEAVYEWLLEGGDPYAIKIKTVGSSDKYVHQDGTTANLDATPTTFMILNKSGYQYGVLAKTGERTTMLSGNGNAFVTSGDPNHFIIFALSTYKVIYHLMIKNIGQKIIIPYKGTDNVLVDEYVIKESGTTMRDLKSRDVTTGTHYDGDKYQLGESLSAIGLREGHSTDLFARDSIYCYDGGHVSLGDALKVPSAFYRPNVDYDFYIEGVYSSDGKNEIADMNTEYKGRKRTNMGEDGGLLDNIVFVNIVYRFKGDLDTNTGSGFVTNVSQNKWYTFETNDATPRLAEYTGSLQTQSGYATHYTNDYLWSPVGDPYGFKMYNRYAYKNLGHTNDVMTTTIDHAPTAGDAFILADNTSTITGFTGKNNGYDVYELLATSTTTPGYFNVHPVVNNTGLQYYINSNSSTGAMTLSTTPTEWAFGLSEDVMSPYYQTAGYVGGLNDAGKDAYDKAAAKTKPLERLMGIQDVVYNHDNDGSDPENPNYIVHYAPGYYRLHSQPGSMGITTPRYASGYTHKIELTAGDGGIAIPLHFYEQSSYSVNNATFDDLGSGFTVTNATRGEIPLQTVENDPASIFRFSGEVSSATISTQGLNVYQNKMDASNSSSFSIIDIGGGIVALQSGDNFLNYNQTSQKYDLKFDNAASAIESARWCLQPVQKKATAGNGKMGLTIKTNDGKDGYYYTTFCAPFDVLLPTTATAYVFQGDWPSATVSKTLTPDNIGKHNIGTYSGSNQFIPAGTPVIIRTRNSSGTITAALPTTAPSTPVSCVFTGKYLEQMLDHGSDYVYTFGLPSTGTFTEDTNFATNGKLTAELNSPGTGVGFYKNANPNKEESQYRSGWTLNNKYVYGNRIYYRAPGSGGGSPAPAVTRGIDFVPVIFGFEPGDEEQQVAVGDNRIYDLLGRCVATEEQVKDGSWRQLLPPGLYIINGKKVKK